MWQQWSCVFLQCVAFEVAHFRFSKRICTVYSEKATVSSNSLEKQKERCYIINNIETGGLIL